jgi:hypothetical protein
LASDPYAVPNRETIVCLWTIADEAMTLLGFLRGWSVEPKGVGKRWRADVLESVRRLGSALDELAHWKRGAGTRVDMKEAG